MNNTIVAGQQAISNVTPAQLTGVGGNLSVFYLKALSTNTKPIWIGTSGVTASTGYPLAPGEALDELELQSVSKLFLIAEVNNEKVSWVALRA